MTSQAKATLLELALLGLTHGQAMSGYDLRKVFAETALGHYSSSPGAIYPALKRLEARGLLSSAVDDSSRLRPKRLYRPTQRGRRLLQAWVNAPLSEQEAVSATGDAMLRFAFMSQLGAAARARPFLRVFAAAATGYASRLERQLALMPAGTGRLALLRGIENLKADARWARLALRELGDNQKEKR